MKHPIEVPTAKNLEELGTKIAKLRYDAVLVVFQAMLKEFVRQKNVDRMRGHNQLKAYGGGLVRVLCYAVGFLHMMLIVSVPHMREDIKRRPLLIDPDEL